MKSGFTCHRTSILQCRLWPCLKDGLHGQNLPQARQGVLMAIGSLQLGCIKHIWCYICKTEFEIVTLIAEPLPNFEESRWWKTFSIWGSGRKMAQKTLKHIWEWYEVSFQAPHNPSPEHNTLCVHVMRTSGALWGETKPRVTYITWEWALYLLLLRWILKVLLSCRVLRSHVLLKLSIRNALFSVWKVWWGWLTHSSFQHEEREVPSTPYALG